MPRGRYRFGSAEWRNGMKRLLGPMCGVLLAIDVGAQSARADEEVKIGAISNAFRIGTLANDHHAYGRALRALPILGVGDRGLSVR